MAGSLITERLAATATYFVFLVCFVVACTPHPSSDISNHTTPSASDERNTGLTIIHVDRQPKNATSVDRVAAKTLSSNDDWDTERLSDAAAQQLARLRSALESDSGMSDAALARILHPTIKFSPLLPTTLDVHSQDGVVVSRQITRPDTQEFQPSNQDNERFIPQAAQGLDSARGALTELVHALGSGETRRVKFKVISVEQFPNGFATRVLYTASQLGPDSARQQNATWNCHWLLSRGNASAAEPLLRVINVEQFESVESTSATGRHFSDRTVTVLGKNPSYVGQVVPGINHWLSRISREFIGQFGHHGLAIADVNGDGLDDVYACDAGGLPNRLYIQQPDGTAEDVSARAGLDFLDDSTAALFVDLDNDGDQDLILATDSFLQVAANDGAGHFTLHGRYNERVDMFSLAAADYDQDGDVDVYVCGYEDDREDLQRSLPFPQPYHDANNGGRNALLRNEGQLRFTDVTEEVGLDVNNRRFSLAAAWEDFDEDGDQDLYVANDFGRNNLYRNDQGTFVDVAAQTGVEDHASGMSVSWGDFDRNGRMDVYIGNMFSAAGNRITYQRKFEEGLDNQIAARLRHMAIGNTLFANIADDNLGSRFADVGVEAGVNMGRWAWGSKFLDLNNDGWQDLVVANGYITNERKNDL